MSTTTDRHSQMLSRVVARRTGFKHADVKEIVNAFTYALAERIGKGRRVEIRGLGVFTVKPYKGSLANLGTGKGRFSKTEAVEIPPHMRVKFKATRGLRQVVIQLPVTSAH